MINAHKMNLSSSRVSRFKLDNNRARRSQVEIFQRAYNDSICAAYQLCCTAASQKRTYNFDGGPIIFRTALNSTQYNTQQQAALYPKYASPPSRTRKKRACGSTAIKEHWGQRTSGTINRERKVDARRRRLFAPSIKWTLVKKHMFCLSRPKAHQAMIK